MPVIQLRKGGWNSTLQEWSAPIASDDRQFIAWAEAFKVCGPTYCGRFLTKVSVLVGWICHQTPSERRDKRKCVWGGTGWLLGGGDIDLSPAAKSHCMSLSDGEHYSQSLWINSTAAPHNPPACPQTNYLIHKQCMMGEPRERSTLNPHSRRCRRICFARKLLLIRWGDPYLLETSSTETFSDSSGILYCTDFRFNNVKHEILLQYRFLQILEPVGEGQGHSQGWTEVYRATPCLPCSPARLCPTRKKTRVKHCSSVACCALLMLCGGSRLSETVKMIND